MKKVQLDFVRFMQIVCQKTCAGVLRMLLSRTLAIANAQVLTSLLSNFNKELKITAVETLSLSVREYV